MKPLTTLSIYVMPHCRGCARARHIAKELRRLVPDVHVNLVDISDGGELPALVFSVPTYMLDDTVISLGNPRIDDLIHAIHSRIGGSADTA
jgi:hypothetical protein